ncbi:transglutaminase family protein [Candidatus Micrarchaeota archaeon]|nr:transglutaminase family protein [Candidatus Micrarchaeota archaeon]
MRLYPILLSIIVITILVSGCCSIFNPASNTTKTYNPVFPTNNSIPNNSSTQDNTSSLPQQNYTYSPRSDIDLLTQTYVSPIIPSNIELRRQAANSAKNCPSGSKECQMNAVYRYVVENFSYYADPIDQIVQTPNQTIAVGGGDCEDFTILLNSYLENLGIETYVVLTPTHAYSLGCDVNTSELFPYIQDSMELQAVKDFKKQGQEAEIRNGKLYVVSAKNLTFSISRDGGYYYYGGDGSTLNSPYTSMDIDYSVSSSAPLDIYVVPTPEDAKAVGDGRSYTAYNSCRVYSAYSISESCKRLTQYGNVVFVNNNNRPAEVSLNVKFYYEYSSSELMKNVSLKYYTLEGKRCVVLDGTLGKYGYPGDDTNLAGNKTAINTRTKKYYYIQ